MLKIESATKISATSKILEETRPQFHTCSKLQRHQNDISVCNFEQV